MPKPTSLLKENRRDQERNGRCALDKQTFARNAYIDHQYIQGRYCFETRNLTLNDIERLLFPRDVRLSQDQLNCMLSSSLFLLVSLALNSPSFFQKKFSVLFRDKGFLSTEKKKKVSLKLGLFSQI